MMFDVRVRESKQKARYYRIHDSMLSRFVLCEQLKGFLVFSVITLFRPQMKDVVAKHTIGKGIDYDSLDSVDPIDDRAMIDSHGF